MRNNTKKIHPKFENWDKCTECLEITKELHNNVTIYNVQVVGEFEFLCDVCYDNRKSELDMY